MGYYSCIAVLELNLQKKQLKKCKIQKDLIENVNKLYSTSIKEDDFANYLEKNMNLIKRVYLFIKL